jgi:hypothetical protein
MAESSIRDDSIGVMSSRDGGDGCSASVSGSWVDGVGDSVGSCIVGPYDVDDGGPYDVDGGPYDGGGGGGFRDEDQAEEVPELDVDRGLDGSEPGDVDAVFHHFLDAFDDDSARTFAAATDNAVRFCENLHDCKLGVIRHLTPRFAELPRESGSAVFSHLVDCANWFFTSWIARALAS